MLAVPSNRLHPHGASDLLGGPAGARREHLRLGPTLDCLGHEIGIGGTGSGRLLCSVGHGTLAAGHVKARFWIKGIEDGNGSKSHQGTIARRLRIGTSGDRVIRLAEPPEGTPHRHADVEALAIVGMLPLLCPCAEALHQVTLV